MAILLVSRELHQPARPKAASESRIEVGSHVRTSGTTRYWPRFLRLVAVTTLALWVGTPGESALLQLFTSRMRSHYSKVTIGYRYLSEVDMGARSALSGKALFSEYTRLLLSQGEYLYSPADFYGNVKVPDFARLSNHTQENADWTHVPSDKTVYSSVLGVPVSGIPTMGTTTFTIENSYYHVTCDNVTLGALQPFWIIQDGHAIFGSPIYNGPFSETNTTFGLDTMGGLSVSTAGFQVCESY